MNKSMERGVQQRRFAIAELQKRIEVLNATREDLERQIRKLTDSVPEETIDASAHKEGYVSYGSYAQSVIERKKNLRNSLEDINTQHTDLATDLQIAMDALDSFERVRARKMAAEAEKRMKRSAG